MSIDRLVGFVLLLRGVGQALEKGPFNFNVPEGQLICPCPAGPHHGLGVASAGA